MSDLCIGDPFLWRQIGWSIDGDFARLVEKFGLEPEMGLS